MAINVGQRTTSQAAGETRVVRRIDEKIAMLEPNIGPLITLMSKMKKRAPIDATKREWFEDDYVPRWVTAGAEVANTTASTTVTVSDGTAIVVGQQLAAPKSSTATTVPEVIRVTAKNGNVLTVVRAIGGVGVDTIANGAPLRIIGTAYEEGAAIGAMKSTSPVAKYNYTQIFRTVVDYSKTNVAIRQYGVKGSDRERELTKKLKEHKIDMAAAMMWGTRSEDLSGGPSGKPIRTMGGLNQFVASNIFDCSGTLSFKLFEEFSRMAFRYGSDTKLLLAAPKVCSAINMWGHSFLQVKPGENVLGVRITSIETAHGTWKLVRDWMLEDGVAGQNGFGHCAFSIDMDEIEYNYLSNNGENRDTHLRKDVVQDGRDAYVDEIITECTMKVGEEKYHSKLINVTDFQNG